MGRETNWPGGEGDGADPPGEARDDEDGDGLSEGEALAAGTSVADAVANGAPVWGPEAGEAATAEGPGALGAGLANDC